MVHCRQRHTVWPRTVTGSFHQPARHTYLEFEGVADWVPGALGDGGLGGERHADVVHVVLGSEWGEAREGREVGAGHAVHAARDDKLVDVVRQPPVGPSRHHPGNHDGRQAHQCQRGRLDGVDAGALQPFHARLRGNNFHDLRQRWPAVHVVAYHDRSYARDGILRDEMATL